jgi:hypothetical protein
MRPVRSPGQRGKELSGAGRLAADFAPLDCCDAHSTSEMGLGCAENSSGRATRRNISEQLHLWESNHTAHATFDALLETCVFYISRMYEFSHSVGHTRSFGDVGLECAPGAGQVEVSDLTG